MLANISEDLKRIFVTIAIIFMFTEDKNTQIYCENATHRDFYIHIYLYIGTNTVLLDMWDTRDYAYHIE